MTVIFLIVALFTLVLALYAVLTKDRTVAVLSAGAAGLFASILFIMMAAPDVAMTEAAIGSGLTTFIFFFALKKVKRGQGNG